MFFVGFLVAGLIGATIWLRMEFRIIDIEYERDVNKIWLDYWKGYALRLGGIDCQSPAPSSTATN